MSTNFVMGYALFLVIAGCIIILLGLGQIATVCGVLAVVFGVAMGLITLVDAVRRGQW